MCSDPGVQNFTWFQFRHSQRDNKAALGIYPSVRMNIVAQAGNRKEKGRGKTPNRKIFCKYALNLIFCFFEQKFRGTKMEFSNMN